MDKNEIYDKIKNKLIECATTILGIVEVNLPDDMEDRVKSIMTNNLKLKYYTDNFFSELLSFLNGINLHDKYGRGLDITLIPGTNNIQISLHDYKFIPIIPASLRPIKPFSPYCLALKKFVELMDELASMCQKIILEQHPESQASVETIIRTGMLSSFHKSKEVCENHNKPHESTRIKNKSLIDAITPVESNASTSASGAALSIGGSKSRRRHRRHRKPARKTRRGRIRKSMSKTHRRKRHSRIRKHKKNTSRRK